MPALLAIYERIHCCILEFLGIFLQIFRNLKYRNPRNETEALVLLKKRNKKDTFVILKFVWLISQCNT